jgi:pyridoxamine 5'-phosphate oxidase
MKGVLAESDLQKDPISQFQIWFDEARQCSEIKLPEAMCLSTVSPQGFPEGRMVLLKDFNSRGFVFYTNFESPKAKSLEDCPKAALTFYWEKLRRQVRIQGTVQKVNDAESDAYFQSRPRESQIGAWASRQSEVLSGRKALDEKFKEYRKKFEGREIPCPSFWGGFRVVPKSIEFWQERSSRLHDRFLYTRQAGGGWKIVRLSP